MAGSHPIPQAPGRVAIPPMGADASDAPVREPSRQSARRAARYTVPEPHEKFEIPPHMIPKGMDPLWLPVTIAGAPNPLVGDYYRAGWQPAAASDFPELSGYGTEYPESMVSRGLLKNVGAEEPIVKDGLMLVLRPKELSAAAREYEKSEANAQVDNQMRRLKQASRAWRGTEIKRGRYAPMPDTRPDDGDGFDEE